MKTKKTFLIIAVVYITVNTLFLKSLNTLPAGKSMLFVFIIPLFWVVMLFIIFIIERKNRKKRFGPDINFSIYIYWVVFSIVSVFVLYYFLTPDIELSESTYMPGNGVIIKSEEWIYSESGNTAAKKYWKYNSEDYFDAEDKDFMRDSLWVYFDKKGDTIRREKYKNGRLIKARNYP